MLDAGLTLYAPPPCDGIEDITDAWLEETDPENERGETCDARFDDELSRHGCRCALTAITLTFDDGRGPQVTHLTRDLAIRLMTFTTVSRLERERQHRLTDR